MRWLSSGACPAGGAGLLERSTAVDSLEAVAEELRRAKAAMLSFVPPAEHHIVESFFSRTVQAAGGPRPHCCLLLARRGQVAPVLTPSTSALASAHVPVCPYLCCARAHAGLAGTITPQMHMACPQRTWRT